MCMQFAIPAKWFEHTMDHPEHGAYNRALERFVGARWPDGIIRKNGSLFLDIEDIFLEQAREAGVRHAWSAHSLADFPDLAHTRDGRDPRRRNLFVVKRDK